MQEYKNRYTDRKIDGSKNTIDSSTRIELPNKKEEEEIEIVDFESILDIVPEKTQVCVESPSNNDIPSVVPISKTGIENIKDMSVKTDIGVVAAMVGAGLTGVAYQLSQENEKETKRKHKKDK